MLKELYQQVVADTKKAVEPKLIDLPDGKVLLCTSDGEQILQRDRVLHSDTVSSTESLLDWCMRYDEAELVVKVLRGRIIVASDRDEAHNSDKLKFDLTLTRAFADLLLWVERPRSQQQVVAALRTALAGTFDEKLLPIFRRLDFSRKNDGTKSITHTGESLGKSIEARAQTASGEIPEMLVFSPPLYSNILTPMTVLRFALDVDANQELIKIAPIGDCIDDPYKASSLSIVSDLKQKLPKALVICCD